MKSLTANMNETLPVNVVNIFAFRPWDKGGDRVELIDENNVYWQMSIKDGTLILLKSEDQPITTN